MRQILCVEDSPEVRLMLETALGDYLLTFATSLREARQAIAASSFSLVLLDIGLPDGSGIELMAERASLLSGVPVIFLTGRDDLASKASAFSLGAEDFIRKPFDPIDLRLRLDARIRKASEGVSSRGFVRFGSVTCRTEEQKITWGTNEGGHVTSIEARLFAVMAQTPQKIFTRTELLDRVWGQGISVSDRVVDVHISKLRKKLAGSGVSIESVTGTGYRICESKESLAS